jgi:hypothetical protein
MPEVTSAEVVTAASERNVQLLAMGFLAGYKAATRTAYSLDLRQWLAFLRLLRP